MREKKVGKTAGSGEQRVGRERWKAPDPSTLRMHTWPRTCRVVQSRSFNGPIDLSLVCVLHASHPSAASLLLACVYSTP